MKKQILEMLLKERLMKKADVVAVVEYLDKLIVYIFENTIHCHRVTVINNKTVESTKGLIPTAKELQHIISAIQSEKIVQVKENYTRGE